LCEFGDPPGGHDCASVEMNLVAVIVQVWTCTRRPESSKFGDALRGHDRVSVEIWTWCPKSCEFGDVNFEAVIVRV
jgi:hypothetical protein